MGFVRIESEHLVLRRFEDRDLVPLLACRNDPVVARYQRWESVSEREAWDTVRRLECEQPELLAGGFNSPSRSKARTTSSGTAP